MNVYILLGVSVVIATVPNLFLRARLLAEIRETYQLLDVLLCSMGATEAIKSNGHRRSADPLAEAFYSSIRTKKIR